VVRAGDHDHLLAVRVHVVPDGAGLVQAQRQGGVVQAEDLIQAQVVGHRRIVAFAAVRGTVK